MKHTYLLLIALLAGFLLSGCATSHYYSLPAMEFKDIDYGFETKYVNVRNITLGYIDEGSGDQVILMIHGLGSNAKGWIKNIPVLAEKYRVIAVDLPGYGKSDKGDYKYSLPFYAQVITEMMTNLGIEKAVFAGHSMGGQIAMITAMQYPDRVSKLVLISPAGFERFLPGEGHWLTNVMTPELVHDTPIRNIDMNLRANFYETPEDAEFMVTERIQARKASDFDDYCYAVSCNVAAMINAPVWDKLDRITHPTLIFFGENDGLIPNPYLHAGFTHDVARKGAEQIPDSRLVMIPECGHFVQFEKYEVVNAEIENFLTN